MVDEKAIPFIAGVSISFLPFTEQCWLLSALAKRKLTVEAAQTLKELSGSGLLTMEAVQAVLDCTFGKEDVMPKPMLYSTKTGQDFSKYIKCVTKKRPLTEQESKNLLTAIKQTADQFLQSLED